MQLEQGEEDQTGQLRTRSWREGLLLYHPEDRGAAEAFLPPCGYKYLREEGLLGKPRRWWLECRDSGEGGQQKRMIISECTFKWSTPPKVLKVMYLLQTQVKVGSRLDFRQISWDSIGKGTKVAVGCVWGWRRPCYTLSSVSPSSLCSCHLPPPSWGDKHPGAQGSAGPLAPSKSQMGY